MEGERNLDILLKSMKPKLNAGDYVFCSVKDLVGLSLSDCIMTFKEEEGLTLILTKEIADSYGLAYSFVSSWLTLTVHSSLEAVGLTAAFSKALAEEGISCNVVAAYFHDHIFVNKLDANRALEILNRFSSQLQ